MQIDLTPHAKLVVALSLVTSLVVIVIWAGYPYYLAAKRADMPPATITYLPDDAVVETTPSNESQTPTLDSATPTPEVMGDSVEELPELM